MIFDKFINKSNLKKYNNIADEVDKMYKNETAILSIDALKDALAELKDNHKMDKRKKTIRALAIAKSAATQVLGMTYYRVQLIGGMALIDGNMAEMKTGEGKTLTCSIATITNYALGFKTHVITANEYLSTRDEATLKPLYSALGISSSTNVAAQGQEEKKNAYNSDILYSTASELGFDYLRDNLVQNIEDKVQPLDFQKVKIIIDEADFVLIDEATTPLIISGQKPLKDLDIYLKIREMVADFTPVSLDPQASRLEIDSFIPDGDFWLDKRSKRTFLSDIGFEKLEQRVIEMGIIHNHHHDLYHDSNSWLVNEICQCLNANFIYEKDKDYVVMDDEIVIVDPNTGRLSIGRSWSNGLHQAIQAKEGITIKPENTTTGTITIQNFLKLYHQISGMSGTIMQSTEEFEQIYNCSTISIPPNRPSQRIDYDDQIYKNANDKYTAMIEHIKKVHSTGQPILIGTVSVSESELVSDLLHKHGIKHQVINAKNHALEAKIIAQAGQKFKVTVATSMAGRGTDIILGGNKEAIIDAIAEDYQHLAERIEFTKYLIEETHGETTIELDSEDFPKKLNLDYTLNNEDINQYYKTDYLNQRVHNDFQQLMQDLYQIQYNLNAQLTNIQSEWEKMRDDIISLKGLFVVGSSRNVSVRIDNQLIGRAGRQGDPGASLFFMSLEDPWIKVFGNTAMMQKVALNIPDGQRIDTPMIRRIFKRAQIMSEGQNFEARKGTFQYDTVSDEGRKEFFKIRDTFLLNREASLSNILKSELIRSLSPITNHAFENFLEKERDITINDGLDYILKDEIPVLLKLIEKFEESSEYQMYDSRDNDSKNSKLLEKINQFIDEDRETNEDKKYAFGYSAFYTINELDDLWIDHLSYIDTAKKSVGYASLVQKNPLHEYRKLCFESFAFLFNNFTAKCLENYIHAYSNREEIIQNAISQQKELEVQLEQIRFNEEQKRIKAETEELLITRKPKRIFDEKELIEQAIPETLYKAKWIQSRNAHISLNNEPLKETTFDNVNKNIREAQRMDFVNLVIGNSSSSSNAITIVDDTDESALNSTENQSNITQPHHEDLVIDAILKASLVEDQYNQDNEDSFENLDHINGIDILNEINAQHNSLSHPTDTVVVDDSSSTLNLTKINVLKEESANEVLDKN